MHVIAEVKQPEKVEVSVTVTMTVAGWREVTDALKEEEYGGRWHAATFCELLREQIRKVEYQALGIARQDEK